LTGGLVGSWLGVRLPARDTIAILGAHALALELAGVLRRADHPVVFLDSNPTNCRRAEEAGFSVVFGNALSERTQQRARFERVYAVAGLTSNSALNGLFFTRARELFNVPEGFIATAPGDQAIAAEIVQDQEALVVFDGAHDVERWDVRARHGDVRIEEFVFQSPETDGRQSEEGDESRRAGERFVMLAVRRGQKTELMSSSRLPKDGDVASVAIHADESQEAVEELAEIGWVPVAGSGEAGAELGAAAEANPKVGGEGEGEAGSASTSESEPELEASS